MTLQATRLSIGIYDTHGLEVWYDVIFLYMDAKQWKKDMLRSHELKVVIWVVTAKGSKEEWQKRESDIE